MLIDEDAVDIAGEQQCRVLLLDELGAQRSSASDASWKNRRASRIWNGTRGASDNSDTAIPIVPIVGGTNRRAYVQMPEYAVALLLDAAAQHDACHGQP